jgi:hypothetical protein
MIIALDEKCEQCLQDAMAKSPRKQMLSLLLPILGERLRVPAQFIGLGDMSRGGILLRCVREQRELDYIAASSIPARSMRAGRKKMASGAISSLKLVHNPVVGRISRFAREVNLFKEGIGSAVRFSNGG